MKCSVGKKDEEKKITREEFHSHRFLLLRLLLDVILTTMTMMTNNTNTRKNNELTKERKQKTKRKKQINSPWRYSYLSVALSLAL